MQFLRENDYFARFLKFQRTLFLNLSEEMKTKIILSVTSTNKIIHDSSKELLTSCKRDLKEMELVTSEREKYVKSVDIISLEIRDILNKIRMLNSEKLQTPDRKPRQMGKFEDRLIELKLKRNELSIKFDEITAKMNSKMRESSQKIMKSLKAIDMDENSRRRTLIIGIRNIHNMVVEGYESYGSKNDFESKLKSFKPDYLEMVVPKMPISWVGVPYPEVGYEQFLENSNLRMNNDAWER